MVLSVNKFQNILQKGAFDADFSTPERGWVWYDHPALDGTTDIKLPLPRWGYTARTLLVVRGQKCAYCSSVKPTRVIKRKSRASTERVDEAWRPWTLPAWELRASGQIPWGKTQTRAECLDRE